MKRFLALYLTVVLCLCCLASCGSTHKESTWFSEEKLIQCIVGELPTIEKYYVNHNDEDIYVSFTSKERESYVAEVFEYLKSQNFKYLGTRGEQKGTLAGTLTTYYFEPATELSEFYVDSAYRFVYCDGTLDDYGDLVFCIISIYDYETKTLEYGTKNFAYNTLITLDYKSEAPLSGFYVLKDYSVTMNDPEWLAEDINSTYKAGDIVEVKISMATDTGYMFFVNGEEVAMSDWGDGLWIFRFTMPECDVEIDFKTYDGFLPDYNYSVLIRNYWFNHFDADYIGVQNYYGEFNSGAIVAYMRCDCCSYVEELWTEYVGGYEINYSNGHRIEVLYNGEFYTLTEAYENAYLTVDDIADISEKHIEYNPYLYE